MGAGNAAFTTVNSTSSAPGVQLLAARKGRKGFILRNRSTAILYVIYGSGTPSSSNHTVAIAANTQYIETKFSGPLSGIWASVNGSVNITELF